MKKLFYQLMFDLCDFIMWMGPLDNREHFARWWEASEYYRRKRDAS